MKLQEFIEEFRDMQKKCLDKTTGLLFATNKNKLDDQIEAFEIDAKLK